MDTMKAAISTLGTHLETIFSEVGTNGDICIHITNSLCCTAETNNIVNQLYFNKYFLKRKKNILTGSYIKHRSEVE